MVKKGTMAAAAALALFLAGCAADATTAGQPAPTRNSLGQQVDPKTGLPLPGSPPIGGGY